MIQEDLIQEDKENLDDAIDIEEGYNWRNINRFSVNENIRNKLNRKFQDKKLGIRSKFKYGKIIAIVTCDLVDNEPYYKYYNYKKHGEEDFPENEDDYERTSCEEFLIEDSDFEWIS